MTDSGATPGEGREAAVTGAVVAGGRSRRMGVDKRGLAVDGVPMLRRVALAVASVSGEVLVACRRDDPPDASIIAGVGARLVYDRLPDGGPLGGLEASLAEARGDLVVVVATDLAWLQASLLRLLIDEARAHPEADAVAVTADRAPEPLLAVYRRRVLPVVRALLDAGVRTMQVLLDAIEVVEVGPERWRRVDPSGLSLRNVNEPADLGDRRRDESDLAGP